VPWTYLNAQVQQLSRNTSFECGKMWTQIFLIASLILFTGVPVVDAGKDWCDVLIIGSRAASFKRPLLSVVVSLCVGNFEAKYLEN